jgi:hypothetical protein
MVYVYSVDIQRRGASTRTSSTGIRGVVVIVIIGLVVFFVALLVGIAGVLSNAGADHPMTDNFSVFGYHVTGSTGTLFLFGIVVGAVAMLGMSTLLAGARRTARRERNARGDLLRSERETAYVNRDRTSPLTRPSSADPGQ